MDGEKYAVSFAVREDSNGRRYYDHSLTKIEALDQLNDQAPKVSAESQAGFVRQQESETDARPYTARASSAGKQTLNNILKKHLAVNNKNEPTRETHSTLK